MAGSLAPSQRNVGNVDTVCREHVSDRRKHPRLIEVFEQQKCSLRTNIERYAVDHHQPCLPFAEDRHCGSPALPPGADHLRLDQRRKVRVPPFPRCYQLHTVLLGKKAGIDGIDGGIQPEAEHAGQEGCPQPAHDL